MPVLTIKNLALSFGARALFSDLTFNIENDDRVGLVGRNGAGKSSLMKILAGALGTDSGSVALRRGARVGYLPQDILSLPAGSVLESVLASVPGRNQLEADARAAEEALSATSEPEEQAELGAELAELHEQLIHFDDRFGAHRAGQILLGLGFKNDQLGSPVGALSGGWRMRAALASLLLQAPDVLLLDEPTNHLDAPTLAWFDSFLRRFPHALILISHDRSFLNRHARRIVAVAQGRAELYVGNYDAYVKERALREEQRLNRQKNLLDKREQLQTFVDRFGAKNTKATQAQSKRKLIEKLDEELESLPDPGFQRALRFRFPEVQPSGKEVLRLEKVAKRFGENIVYKNASSIVQRGERIAIVGRNGAGKTTLLKLIGGELQRDSGEVIFGHNVVLAYFAQHHGEQLDAKKTIAGELDAFVADAYRGRIGQAPTSAMIRQIAGAFLFSGDDIDKRISVLSGGERARVALAKLLIVPSNLLLLDEPTNHLDLESSEALAHALSEYPGTMIFVSHNRSFVEQLATKLWVVDDGELHTFPGNFADYLASQTTDDDAPATSGSDKPHASKERRRQDAQARAEHAAKLKPLQKAVTEAEKRIAILEVAQREAEKRLADPDFYKTSEAAALTREFVSRKNELEALYGKWEEAQRALEQGVSS